MPGNMGHTNWDCGIKDAAGRRLRSIFGIIGDRSTWGRYSWLYSAPRTLAARRDHRQCRTPTRHDVAQVTSFAILHDNPARGRGPTAPLRYRWRRRDAAPSYMGFHQPKLVAVSRIVDLLAACCGSTECDSQAQVRHHKSRYDSLRRPSPPCRRGSRRPIVTTTPYGQSSGPRHEQLRRRGRRLLWGIVCSCCQRQHRCEGRSGPRGAPATASRRLARALRPYRAATSSSQSAKKVVVLPRWPQVARFPCWMDSGKNAQRQPRSPRVGTRR